MFTVTTTLSEVDILDEEGSTTKVVRVTRIRRGNGAVFDLVTGDDGLLPKRSTTASFTEDKGPRDRIRLAVSSSRREHAMTTL